MNTDRVAVISDIHANRWALQAVLEDIDRRGITRIVNLGDTLYGPLDPAGTADILSELSIPTVSGNQDRIIVEDIPAGEIVPTLSFVRRELRATHIKWLKSLTPTMVAFDRLFLCHGTPECDDEYLLRKASASGLVDRTEDELGRKTSGVGQTVILCGHDHSPGSVQLPNGTQIINPGSVGLQAYQDETPLPHVVENGTPDARYCVVSPADDHWTVENVVVAYDWKAAASAADKNGRADWVHWLTAGTA